MSWDTGAATTGWDANNTGGDDDNWKEGGGGGLAGDFTAEATTDGFSGGFDVGNGGFGGGDGGAGGDDICRNCGQSGHFSRECPEPKKMGECFNCGQLGHNKADCTNEKVDRPFTGTCRHCEKEGHRAAECPDKPAETCRLCGKEGHKALTCEELRTDLFKDAEEMSTAEAWEKLRAADMDKDIDDFKTAFFCYAKANFSAVLDGQGEPIDLADLEKGFRTEGMNMYFIGKERENLSDTYTIISPSGKVNQKFILLFSWSAKPKRKFFSQGWPTTPEENLERLKEAGLPCDRGVAMCDNCGELGHIKKHCKEEKKEIDQPEIKCVVCNEIGHRARDCKQERVDPFACRNCKKSGHTSRECPEPRSAENVECKHCNEMGHFAKDCPTREKPTCRNCGEEGHISKECEKPRVFKCRNCDQEGHQARECTEPRNPATITCRNCEKTGHFSKECPEPKDWSKVQCKNCGEFGHTPVKCKVLKESENEEGGDFSGGFGGESAAVGASATAGGWGGDGGVSVAAGGW